MMQKGFAERFAREWVEAWNAHDLERVLSHYEDDFEMSSPIIATLMGESSGKLKVLHFGQTGKVRAAFAHYVEWSA